MVVDKKGGLWWECWFFSFVFLYIVDFFNIILILEYIILIYRIEE